MPKFPDSNVSLQHRSLHISLPCAICLALAALAHADPVAVKIARTDKGFELQRAGKPFVINGVGGQSRLEELVAAGGNSIRTWSADHADRVLDRAEKLGLCVTVGIWIGHERHGFNYNDANAVAQQHEKALAAVRKYKDHPAVLMWGIGNEMEADGNNPRIWKAINDIAKAIHEIDPNHPTMTVLAGTGHDKVRKFVEHCPDIDVLGVNGYGDLSYIPRELERQGLDRPFAVTEFGPYGWWEVGKTSWGAELEPTSTQKADTYLRGFEAVVLGQPDHCLGAYAFLWGDKQEHTHTWFGMFLPTGERTAAVDVMTKVWTGKWPKNRCPAIKSFVVSPEDPAVRKGNDNEHIYAPAALLNAKVTGADPENDKLTVRWELRSESTDKRSGGDPEQIPALHKNAIVKAEGDAAVIRLPEAPGPYRLFVFVLDGDNNAATANIPVLVK